MISTSYSSAILKVSPRFPDNIFKAIIIENLSEVSDPEGFVCAPVGIYADLSA